MAAGAFKSCTSALRRESGKGRLWDQPVAKAYAVVDMAVVDQSFRSTSMMVPTRSMNAVPTWISSSVR